LRDASPDSYRGRQQDGVWWWSFWLVSITTLNPQGFQNLAGLKEHKGFKTTITQPIYSTIVNSHPSFRKNLFLGLKHLVRYCSFLSAVALKCFF
jgi:hypothetical protein